MLHRLRQKARNKQKAAMLMAMVRNSDQPEEAMKKIVARAQNLNSCCNGNPKIKQG